MSDEKKPLHTMWNPITKEWYIKIMPEMVTHELTGLTPKNLVATISRNSTFIKFSQRHADNISAIVEGKTQTQQKEGGYNSQLMSAASSAVLMAILNFMNAYYVYHRLKYPLENSDGSLNESREALEKQIFIVTLLLATLLLISTSTFYYFTFFTKDREAKQKQEFQLMLELLRRKPSIDNEVKIKKQTIERLTALFELPSDLLEHPMMTFQEFDNLYKFKRDSKHVLTSDRFDDIESQSFPKKVHDKVSFADIILIALDDTSDLMLCKNICLFLDTLEDFTVSATNKITTIFLVLIRNETLKKFREHLNEKTQQSIAKVGSVSELINFICNSKPPNFITIARFQAEFLIKLLSERDYIHLIDNVSSLLHNKVGKNISELEKLDYQYYLYEHLITKFENKSYKLKSLLRLFEKNNLEINNKLSSYFEALVTLPEFTVECLQAKINQLLNVLDDKFELEKVLSANSNTIVNTNEKQKERTESRLLLSKTPEDESKIASPQPIESVISPDRKKKPEKQQAVMEPAKPKSSSAAAMAAQGAFKAPAQKAAAKQPENTLLEAIIEPVKKHQ